MKALLAKKIGMSQMFAEDGSMTSVTLLQAGPCVVTQLKTEETDGYNAVQIGFGKDEKPNKPKAGHLKRAKATAQHLAEVRLPEADNGKAADQEASEKASWEIGQTITAEVFEAGEKVAVSAVSKGKGFAGTIKRHNFNTGPKTHGSHNYRQQGSIGAGYPQHVFRGMKMPGRMGHDKVTVKNLTVVMVDPGSSTIALKGAVPGPKKSLVMIKGIGL